MKIYRTTDEVEITGSVEELREVFLKLEAVEENDMLIFEFDTNGSPEPFDYLESNLKLIVSNGPACASYKDAEGLKIQGDKQSILVLASFFDFDIGTESGSHNHWDEACGSNYVSENTLPIVISVS